MRVPLVLAAVLFSIVVLQAQSFAQQPLSQRAAHKSPGKKSTKKALPEPPPAPLPPPPPPTLEQMPALPPQVHYSGGQLSIVAENSTLADILRAVRNQTGATVEIPPNANERVVGHFGPGPARDVLSSLLHGSHFNYVLVGSPAHPDGVDRLILTSKSGGSPEPTMAVAPVPNNNNEAPVDEAATPSPDVDPPMEDTPESANTNGDAPPPTPEGQQQVKTPEQLLRELQQQQLLQQQQQQQGQQPGPPPPN